MRMHIVVVMSRMPCVILQDTLQEVMRKVYQYISFKYFIQLISGPEAEFESEINGSGRCVCVHVLQHCYVNMLLGL